MGNSEWIINVTDANFEQDVIERSHRGLVLVDFWAEWCAPCRMLAPILEKLANDYAGGFTLVKANTDETPGAATSFGVSGIPAVFAMLEGKIIDGFQGALPEPAIQEWLDRLLKSATLVDAKRLRDSDPQAAEARLRELLEQEPQNDDARLALGELLLERGDLEQAREIVERLEARGFLEPAAERLKAGIDLNSKSGADLEAVRAAAAAQPENWARQLELAEALAGQQQYVEAFEICLNLVARDRKQTGEKARELMVEVFRVLPEDSPLTSEYRRKLSTALY
jgi:putative thioredoxin